MEERIEGAAFEQAFAAVFLSFHGNRSVALSHAVHRARAMMQRQRIQRPIGIGNHVNGAIAADKNGYFRTRFAASAGPFRRIQYLLGVFGETAHAVLIVPEPLGCSEII